MVVHELHLTWHLLVHFSIQKSAQNDLVKGEIQGALYVTPEDAPNISL